MSLNNEKKISRGYYKGVVYCVSTIAGAVVVERNGKVSVAGNCDIVLLMDKNGDGIFETTSWNTVLDFDKDGEADWMEVTNYFKKIGYEWGGDWEFSDAPHFQKTFGNTWRTLQKKVNSGDVIREVINGKTYLFPKI